MRALTTAVIGLFFLHAAVLVWQVTSGLEDRSITKIAVGVLQEQAKPN